MNEISIVVPGEPIPKKRPRLGRGGRTYTPKATVDYEDQIRWEFVAKRGRPFDGDIALTVRFYCSSGRRVDLDNLVKSAGDALNGHAYRDDSQVVALHAYLYRHSTIAKTEIHVEKLNG